MMTNRTARPYPAELRERAVRLVREHEAEQAALAAHVFRGLDPEKDGVAAWTRADLAAVRAGLETPWSRGPVESQISQLKTIKRTVYGRAGFGLLRSRVLQAA